jgi:hypothetical protein
MLNAHQSPNYSVRRFVVRDAKIDDVRRQRLTAEHARCALAHTHARAEPPAPNRPAHPGPKPAP